MASKNRHLRGDTREIKAPIHGNVTVEKGELMFLAAGASAIVGKTDYYAYPASYLADSTKTYVDYNFLGVSMAASQDGTTEDIAIATDGIFRFQIKTGASATSQYVKIGQTVAACTIGTSGVSLSGTTVCVGNDGDHTNCVIGRTVKAENAATSVDFLLQSMRFSGSTPVQLVTT
jgi:hypothetical protein